MKKVFVFGLLMLTFKISHAVDLTVTIDDASAPTILKNACVALQAGNVNDLQCQAFVLQKLAQYLKDVSFSGNKLTTQKTADDQIKADLDAKIITK